VVAELVERKLGSLLGITATGALRAWLNLTPQEPLQRTYHRDPEAIEHWQRMSYPAIARQARTEGGEIFFWDESGFRADAVHGRTWGVKGQAPGGGASGATAVDQCGIGDECQRWVQVLHLRYEGGYKGGLTAELFVRLLQKMMRYHSKPVHLMVDGLSPHKIKLVQGYVEST
jgi:hypothetical protein